MDHDKARRLMAEATEGRLGHQEERELALHLVGCSTCKSIYEGLQQADPALASINIPDVPDWAVEAAVSRATTVLRGDADPGPAAPPRSPSPPVLGEEAVAPSSPPLQDTGPLLPEDLPSTDPSATPADQEAEPVQPPGPPPMAEPEPAPEPPPRTDQEPPAPEPQPLEPSPDPRPIPIPAPGTGPPVPSAVPGPTPPRLGDEAWAASAGETSVWSQTPGSPPQTETRGTETAAEGLQAPPLMPTEEPPRQREGVGPGPWLVAIAVTIALAVLAGVLITRGQAIFGPGGVDLPPAEELRARVVSTYTEMGSLKANFEIRRLGLYRIEDEGERLRYSFSNGVYEGLVVYDREVGHRQRHTLRVGEQEVARSQTVQRASETELLTGAGADAQLVAVANPALGPPDGAPRLHLGLLEDAVGAVVRMMAASPALEVVGAETHEGRTAYEVRFSVVADEHTRADEVEVLIDSETSLPVVIQRWISAANARVLGPETALTDDHIQTAFGDLDRAVSERVELSSISYNEIILPGDLVLDIPEGTQTEEQDARFGPVSVSGAAEALGYNPLLPEELPDGLQERALVVFRGEEQQPWGPGGAYPAPEGVFAATYFDGMTTVTVTQRRMTETFELDGSPLATGGLPIEVRPMERAEKSFFFGNSPEVTPHVFGFLGQTFVVVSGHAPDDLLASIYAALTESVLEEPEPFDVDGEQ